MSILSIGTDTELFAQNNKGEYIALCGKIGGTKEKPQKIAGMAEGFALQEDNVTVEFNVPATLDPLRWRGNIEAVMGHISTTLFNLEGLKISKDSSACFSRDELSHPAAMIFGCEPDWNAWSGNVNQRPRCDDPSLRTAGGHIHVGTRNNMVEGIQMMDLMLGVPSIVLDDNPSSARRRELYGKAGAMRAKPYGFEYRVLSNFWVFNRNYIDWVFNNTVRAMQTIQSFTKKEALMIQRCINSSNVELANKLIEDYSIPMPK